MGYPTAKDNKASRIVSTQYRRAKDRRTDGIPTTSISHVHFWMNANAW